MSQVNQKPSVAVPNIQDGFLNHARRDRSSVVLRLMDGTSFDARIKTFDKFAIIVEHEGADVMIFKHAIASIRTSRATGSVHPES
ncbi:MAG: hfq [Acidobacteria bacterium]|jgi:host factor-I protein|nr:hfq [Acidobacteriota bacterium]